MKLTIAHKLGLGSVLTVIVSIALVTWLFYTRTTEILVHHALEDISKEVSVAGQRLEVHIENQNRDVLFLANMPPIQGIILSTENQNQQHTSSYLQWTRQLQTIFKSTLENKPDYLALRFIDKEGQELVAVGREESTIVSPIGGILQSKAHRAYVQQTLKLPAGVVYLSEINLNREFGQVTKPHQEVLRNATPVFNQKNGELAGLLVITVEVGQQLREIQQSIQDADSDIFITNDQGDFLLHPEISKSYGFDLGKRFRVQDSLPQAADLFSAENLEQNLILLPEQTDGSSVAEFTKIFFDPARPERFISVGITRNYASVVAEETQILNEVLILASVLAFVGALFGLLFSIGLTRPIKQMTQAVNEFTGQGGSKLQLPVEQTDEVGVLARTFKSMTTQVEEAQENLRKMNQSLEVTVKQRTRSLRDSEVRLRTIVENIADGLLIIDHKGIIQEFNSAAEVIFGYYNDEVLGQNIKMLMPEPYHSEHDGYLTNYFETGKAKIIGLGREVEGRRKDGSVFPLDLAVGEVRLGGVRMFSGIVRDITERKYIDKMKSEFISTVSHELRTPLTSIRGSLGLISGGAVGEIPEQATEMLQIANNNTERLLLLINDILDIQKIESGEMAFRFQKLALMPFLQQAVQDNAAYAADYGVEFVIFKEVEDARVFADKDRLMQAMANLLSNAAKFSPEGEKVEISVARHHGDCLRISVTDHGPGIPEDFQPKLFNQFTQSDSSDARQQGGTGLGLSITQKLVEKHGGRIDFVTRLGIGTTFYIELPELMGQVETDADAPPHLSRKHLPCILIVEDDPDIAALLNRMLAEDGFNSDIAGDANEAHQLLREKPGQYKVITLDLMLPGEDGISFLEGLRREADTRDIPVVVVSVKADEAKRDINGGAVGVIDWLQKPIDQPRLISAIRQASKTDRLPRVLHVEDETDVHKVVSTLLRDYCELTWTTTLAASEEVLEREEFDLVLLDIGLPDGSGLDLLEIIERRLNPPRVVIFSAQNVTQEYADKVSAVLVKSRTENLKLAQVIRDTIGKASALT